VSNISSSDHISDDGNKQMSKSFTMLFLTILVPFGLGHFISYLFRTINAVIHGDLSQDLSLPASSLGLMSSIYFLTFAVAQLPLGVLLDRYGPRVVQSPMLFIAAMGSVVFATSQSEMGLLIGRGLIGLGVAGSLMSAIKACSIWLPPERLPLSTACLLAVGGLGAMASTTPLHQLLTIFDWREAFLLLAGLTVAASIIIYFSVTGHYPKKKTRLVDMSREVARLYGSWSFWRLVVYSVFAHATYMAILSLWMGPWLRDMGGLDVSAMAEVLMYGTVAMVAGSLSFGSLTDYLRRYGVQPLMICGCGITLFVGVQILMISGLDISPYLLVIGFAFFGTSTTMNYAIVAQSVSPDLAGRVSSSFNLVVFVLAFVVQWVAGIVIGQWQSVDGHYPVVAYQWSMGILIALQVPGLLLWLTFKPWRKKGSV
jgi:predicted MFS family arabinose efflux permease